jgi:mercuric ion transport protein
MSLPLRTPTGHRPTTPPVDNGPPTRSKVSGILAAVACAVCCALPLLIAAGVLTTAGAAILEKTLYAVAAGLIALALGMWWLHRRRTAQRAAAAGPGCGGGCGC